MRALPVSLLFVAALAGCLDPDSTPARIHVLGETGFFALGFAYDGQHVNPYDGFVYLAVDDVSNTGTVEARGELGGIYAKPKPCLPAAFCLDDHAVFTKKWFNVSFTGFAGSKDFHDGGIATDLIEHGDSGVGDADIPKVDVSTAGWGWATMRFEGKPVLNPVTGGEWNAHFMVVRNGVRGNADGKMWNAALDRPYDPKSPGDAYSLPNDNEVHLELETGDATSLPRTTIPKSRTADFFTESQVYLDEFENPMIGSKARAWINVTGGAPVNMVFSLLTPSGAYLKNITVSQPTRMSTPILFDANEFGAYILRASGVGARVEYTGSIEFEARPVTLNLWFETVNTGDRALVEAKKWGVGAN